MVRRNISMGGEALTAEQIGFIDPRLHDAMQGWSVHYEYFNGGVSKGQVDIPGTWDSLLYPFQYSEIYKTAADPDNPGIEESEIHLHLGLGWPKCDFEVLIMLRIAGKETLNPNPFISAEVHKFGGAYMIVKRHGKVITDFTDYALWGRFFKYEKAFVVVNNL